MKAYTTHIACGLVAVAFAVFAGPVSAEVPEPQTYWMGPLHSEVPATLSGAEVIHAPGLDALLHGGQAVLVDAASVPHRPENLAPETIWKPVPHENIAGSIWIPGIGEGNIDKNIEAYFRDRLTALTGNDLDRPIVFYCHPHCWASWNAAKRAMGYGYRNVAWYPDGAEGWQDAEHPLVIAQPEGPPQAGH
jgi:PQQ-dependent catabolism-associated CXXCW motif protein